MFIQISIFLKTFFRNSPRVARCAWWGTTQHVTWMTSLKEHSDGPLCNLSPRCTLHLVLQFVNEDCTWAQGYQVRRACAYIDTRHMAYAHGIRLMRISLKSDKGSRFPPAKRKAHGKAHPCDLFVYYGTGTKFSMY